MNDQRPVGYVSQDFLDGKWSMDHIAASDEGQISRTIPVFIKPPQPAEQQPAPDLSELVDALDGAARSLETISKQAGIDEYMRDFLEVRGYARNRALVAFEALAAHRKGGSTDGE